MEKWLKALMNLMSHKKATCPHCGKSNLDYGYVLLNQNKKRGYGAVWCKDCQKALALSRVNLQDESTSDKIMAKLPTGLVYV